MYLHQIAYDSFILMQSDWKVIQAKDLLDSLEPYSAIIQNSDTSNCYYLYPSKDMLQQLANADLEQTLQDALNLNEATATPVCDAYCNAEEAPDFCIVTEEGWVTGFYDVSVPPSQSQKRGDGDSESDDVLARTLKTVFPEQVALNDTASLLVSLSAEDVSGQPLPMLEKGTFVDIIVVPNDYFTIQGRSEGQLKITDEDETPPLQLKLKATELGQGRIRVLAFHNGQAIGDLKLAPVVLEQTMDNILGNHEKKLIGGNIKEPDLTLLILEEKQKITFYLNSRHPEFKLNFVYYGSILLKTESLSYFQNVFRDIENLPLSVSTEEHLARIGAQLFESVLPKDLQTLLWEKKEQIKSVLIQSAEPWIPWELCKLQGKDKNGMIEERGFFCEAFIMTRWILGKSLRSSLTLNNFALVVPTDSNLKYAKEEHDYLVNLSTETRKVTLIDANVPSVIKSLTSGQYDSWHFTGHGSYQEEDPNCSGIGLENKDELYARHISGAVKNLGAIHHPLIFLNACQVGRSGLSLTEIGGFASRSVEAGAGAFIGAYWSIYDHAAYPFAKAFYDRLLAGQPIGKAVREARLEIKQTGDPTWLAYTVYADPFAVVE